MKKLLLIATGGTIASETGEEGLKPGLGAQALLAHVPRLESLYSVDAVQPLSLDSTNMRPENWVCIAECIREHYDAYDGFVISHGTDTMAYTAAALSYLVMHSPKPIILTGAQRSIVTEDTDARTNLYDAFCYASDAASHGVSIVFDGHVITGTRARKVRTKSRNAFESVDYPPVALVRDGRVHALVVESFGVGGLPSSDGGALLKEIRGWREAGKVVALTTQVPYEGSDLALYEVGRRALTEGGVIEAYTMTPETAVVKLMWILARERNVEAVRRRFYEPVAHDLLTLKNPEIG